MKLAALVSLGVTLSIFGLAGAVLTEILRRFRGGV